MDGAVRVVIRREAANVGLTVSLDHCQFAPGSVEVITNGQNSPAPVCGNGAAGIDGTVVVTVEHILDVEPQVPFPGNVRGGRVEPRVAWRAAIERERTVDHVLARGVFQAAAELEPAAVVRQGAEFVGGPGRR